jgi:hypothetical protein
VSPTTQNKSRRVRKNFRLPEDLVIWVERHAKRNKKTMTQVIVDYFTWLRENHK